MTPEKTISGAGATQPAHRIGRGRSNQRYGRPETGACSLPEFTPSGLHDTSHAALGARAAQRPPHEVRGSSLGSILRSAGSLLERPTGRAPRASAALPWRASPPGRFPATPASALSREHLSQPVRSGAPRGTYSRSQGALGRSRGRAGAAGGSHGAEVRRADGRIPDGTPIPARQHRNARLGRPDPRDAGLSCRRDRARLAAISQPRAPARRFPPRAPLPAARPLGRGRGGLRPRIRPSARSRREPGASPRSVALNGPHAAARSASSSRSRNRPTSASRSSTRLSGANA